MNRYSLSIYWDGGAYSDSWDFVIITNEKPEYVKDVIIAAQKEYNFESPIDLLDYICDTYNMKWEDHYFDIEIEYSEFK